MPFRRNQQVVCIDDDFAPGWNHWATKNRPTKGEIYTVRAVMLWHFSNGQAPAILLNEIKNPLNNWQYEGLFEHPFASKRFRPLVKQESSTKTGFEILADILKRETTDDKKHIPTKETIV